MWKTAAVLFGFLACPGARSLANSPAGPSSWIRTDFVTDLSVGETLRLHVDALATGKPVVGKTTWKTHPVEVATIAADGTLTATAPGVVEITATVAGEPELLPEFLTVRRSIPGGRLPQVRGVEGPVEFELRMTAPDGNLPALVLFARWGTQAMGVTLAGLPPGSLPFTHEARRAAYDPHADLGKGESKPARATVRIDSIREGVVSGAVDLVGDEGTKVHLEFVADVPDGGYLASAAVDTTPIAPAAGSKGFRGLRISPRGPRPTTGLVLVHDGRGLDVAFRNQANAWAAEGHDVLAVDLFDGRTSDGDQSARGRELADGVDEARAEGEVSQAIELLEKSADGAARRVGVVGWGIGAEFALRAATRHSELAACVLYYGGSPVELLRDWTSTTRVFGVFGAGDALPPREAVDAFKRSLERSGGRHEIRFERTSGEAVASPYWLFGYGAPATRILHGRVREFVREAMR